MALGFVSSAGAAPAAPAVAAQSSVDCSEVYGKPATCRVVPCGARYTRFLGVWAGPFEEYVQSRSTPQNPVFRPYENRIGYRSTDCLTNPASGETFIVGHETNIYPAFKGLPAQTKHGLLITGRRADGTPFLRTIDDQGRYDYALVSKNTANERMVWQLDVPSSRRPCPTAANPKKTCPTGPMQFRVTDGRDQSRRSANVRDVAIEMTIGPAAHPYWHGVIAQGHHELQAAGQGN
jgi:hypothetical protein